MKSRRKPLASSFDPSETVGSEWSALKRFRRSIVTHWYTLPDTGWFGLTPLRKHLLVCGYPRAGTTMLLAMLEYAYPRSRHFGCEVGGWKASAYTRRNHQLLITKVPQDILVLHQLQNYYRARPTELKVIIALRDPRDVLTSHHVSHDRDYFQDPAEWKIYNDRCRAHRDSPNVMTLKYEDLVADVAGTQSRIESFFGEPTERQFVDFHKANFSEFDTRPLNGIRPVDRQSVGRWAHPRHHARIQAILDQIPDFPQLLIELGYESDTSWVDRWRSGPYATPSA